MPRIERGGSWPGGADCCWGMAQRLVSNCIVHPLPFLGCYFLFGLYSFSLQLVTILLLLFLASSVFWFSLVIKLFLTHDFYFLFPSSSPPH